MRLDKELITRLNSFGWQVTGEAGQEVTSLDFRDLDTLGRSTLKVSRLLLGAHLGSIGVTLNRRRVTRICLDDVKHEMLHAAADRDFFERGGQIKINPAAGYISYHSNSLTGYNPEQTSSREKIAWAREMAITALGPGPEQLPDSGGRVPDRRRVNGYLSLLKINPEKDSLEREEIIQELVGEAQRRVAEARQRTKFKF